MAARERMRPRVLALSWARFQPRTLGLARDLEGEAWFIHHDRLASHRLLAPLRYLSCAVRTWRLLGRRRPDFVIVITPPVFAPLVAWAWCRAHRRPLFVDCHTDAFDSSRWRWARPLHRWLLRHASMAFLHTEAATARVAGWGARARLVPDDLPTVGDAAPAPLHGTATVVVAGSLDGNEPVAESLAAARLLPRFRFRFTGDQSRLPRGLVEGAPDNVTWTGYLRYPDFLAELVAADAVAVFSTDPGIMNRAAFEAVGLGRPLVLSDFPGLRARFGAAAVFAGPSPEEMARATAWAVEHRAELAERSASLSTDLAERRRLALAGLFT